MSDTLTTMDSITENSTTQENLGTNGDTKENTGNQESSGNKENTDTQTPSTPESTPKEDTNSTKPYDVQDALNKKVLPTLERLKQAIESALKNNDLLLIKAVVEKYVAKLESSDKSFDELKKVYTELETNGTTRIDNLVAQTSAKLNELEVTSKTTMDNIVVEYTNKLDKINKAGVDLDKLEAKLDSIKDKSYLHKSEYEVDKQTFALKTELNNRADELSQSLNDGLNTKLNVSSLVSELGSSESLVVSQKTVSDALALKAGLT
ncbi:hypothetical protein, partial [Campylobacter hyointestinalis]|uniref:hypothetical protein n=1 Tax=Campylobacter hyointestinalis TaxID=198 RepID=UPI000D4988B2